MAGLHFFTGVAQVVDVLGQLHQLMLKQQPSFFFPKLLAFLPIRIVGGRHVHKFRLRLFPWMPDFLPQLTPEVHQLIATCARRLSSSRWRSSIVMSSSF